jgi:hypothetical protein
MPQGQIPPNERPPAIGEPNKPVADQQIPPLDRTPRDWVEPMYPGPSNPIPKSATKKGG